MKDKELQERLAVIYKLLKIRVSQRRFVQDIRVEVYSRTYKCWYTVITFKYKGKCYTYREDASYDWITDDETGKEIA